MFPHIDLRPLLADVQLHKFSPVEPLALVPDVLLVCTPHQFLHLKYILI